jgi:hypothetical protein
MNFGTFPYSVIECAPMYTTFSVSSDEVRIVQNQIPSIVFSNELIDIDSYAFYFQVAGFNVIHETETTNYIDPIVGRQFVTGTLKFRHQAGSIWETVYIPDFMLHVAIFASFWVTRQAPPARVTLPIISLLTFRVLMTSLDAQLPDVQYSLWYKALSLSLYSIHVCYYHAYYYRTVCMLPLEKKK